MKNIIPVLFVALSLTCCVSKRTADKIASDRDSLGMVVANKDSLINDIFFSLSQISDNLATIKAREHIINTSVANDEIQKQPTVQINDDIQAIDELLQQNRATIARLQRSADELKRANVRIDALQKVIAQLNGQVAARDSEIVVLKDNLRQMNIQVVDLKDTVSALAVTVGELTGDKARLEGEVKENTDQLNTAYYIVGSQTELLNKEIVYKSGFIGRTLHVNQNHSLETFTRIDLRRFDQVLIGHKNVTVVTTHPGESYELVTDDKGVVSALVIKDKARFWEYSKVLIVSYK